MLLSTLASAVAEKEASAAAAAAAARSNRLVISILMCHSGNNKKNRLVTARQTARDRSTQHQGSPPPLTSLSLPLFSSSSSFSPRDPPVHSHISRRSDGMHAKVVSGRTTVSHSISQPDKASVVNDFLKATALYFSFTSVRRSSSLDPSFLLYLQLWPLPLPLPLSLSPSPPLWRSSPLHFQACMGWMLWWWLHSGPLLPPPDTATVLHCRPTEPLPLSLRPHLCGMADGSAATKGERRRGSPLSYPPKARTRREREKRERSPPPPPPPPRERAVVPSSSSSVAPSYDPYQNALMGGGG